MRNKFLTIYRKDYIPKQLENLKVLNEKNKLKNVEYKEPIAESFKKYLVLENAEKPAEEVDLYYERAKGVYDWLGDITDHKSVNKNLVQSNKIYEGRTVYQVDYCDLEEELAYKEFRRKNAVRLQPDVFIPLTTQRAGYRDPLMINSKAYVKEIVQKPKNNLDPNYKLREILNVVTGISEYTSRIGKLGGQIVEEQLHGIINHSK